MTLYDSFLYFLNSGGWVLLSILALAATAATVALRSPR